MSGNKMVVVVLEPLFLTVSAHKGKGNFEADFCASIKKKGAAQYLIYTSKMQVSLSLL